MDGAISMIYALRPTFIKSTPDQSRIQKCFAHFGFQDVVKISIQSKNCFSKKCAAEIGPGLSCGMPGGHIVGRMCKVQSSCDGKNVQ